MEKKSRKVRFYGETFRKELLEEVFPSLLAHQHTSATFVFQRTACFAHHLEDVDNGVIDVSMLLAFVRLDSHDDHHVTRDGKTPGGVLECAISECNVRG